MLQTDNTFNMNLYFGNFSVNLKSTVMLRLACPDFSGKQDSFWEQLSSFTPKSPFEYPQGDRVWKVTE